MSVKKIVLAAFGTAAAASIVAGGAVAAAGTPQHPAVRPATDHPAVVHRAVHPVEAPASTTGKAVPCTYPAAPGTEKVCGGH
jgi:hypothetical protein